MMTKGIAKLKATGARVHLSYYGDGGLRPTWGGGDAGAPVSSGDALLLAERMAQNVADWDLDGVDIFTIGIQERSLDFPGQNVGFHYSVIKNLRRLLPSGKTISYSIAPYSVFTPEYWKRRSLSMASNGRSNCPLSQVP